jgi:hypothetical protein
MAAMAYQIRTDERRDLVGIKRKNLRSGIPSVGEGGSSGKLLSRDRSGYSDPRTSLSN